CPSRLRTAAPRARCKDRAFGPICLGRALLRPQFESYMATPPLLVQFEWAKSPGNMTMLQTLTERLFDDGNRSGLDPFAVFEEWFALAQEGEANDPHAMAIASADETGLPDVRMVLL